MTRIVYGVSGEGSGHSSRARVVLEHLVRRGHEVKVVTYDRGLGALADDFDTYEVEGLTIVTSDNQVSVPRTFVENLSRLPDGWRRARTVKRELFDVFDPEVVFTDFEPVSAWLAQHTGRPLISIDNQHRMRYMDVPVPEGMGAEARLTRAVIRAIVPRPDQALVTTFWRGPLRNERTFLFAPLLRGVVRALEPTDGEEVLVYFTQDFESALSHLRAVPDQRFVVYGTQRQGQDGNLRFEAPSRDGFLSDLASCRAVIATAGFTLMTEALFLGKPLLALPMAGQFEQELNAALLDEGGWGRNGRDLGPVTVPAFLEGLDGFRSALEGYDPGDEAQLLAHVDGLVADGGAGARAARAHRRGASS